MPYGNRKDGPGASGRVFRRDTCPQVSAQMRWQTGGGHLGEVSLRRGLGVDVGTILPDGP